MSTAREIKFRVWTGSMMEPWNHIQNIAPCHWESDWKVMQFTGLRDSNGKEVYEGDIIQVTDTQSYTCNERAEVVFLDTGWRPKWIKPSENWNDSGRVHLLKGSEYEIIGNRFEHPHLLNS